MTYTLHRRHIKYFLDNSLKAYYKTGTLFETSKIAKEFEEHLKTLNDEQLIEYLLYSIYIPDEYKHDSSEETLFTKLIEVLVSYFFKHLGVDSEYIVTKSGREDVALYFKENKEEVIVSDVKTFRLGRSQQAPNVKDFVKPSDFATAWASHHKNCFGGLIVFPRTHEWKKNSQVYTYCSNPIFPILMLSYTHLVLLLKYKSRFSKDNLKQLWDYSNLKTINSDSKSDYWTSVDDKFISILNLSKEEYNSQLSTYEDLVKENIKLIVEEYIQEIEHHAISLEKLATNMDYETVKKEYIKIKTQYDTEGLVKSIANIEKHRLLIKKK
ncbi:MULTISPECIES: HindIII family type II restriction endonuclease [unclassified Exiguobacterium]|uniref:HindIII family type II restriction endonuclease n=1 Tax=unclassified Exiguobacterium TaxID=2644629 RepID=UPI001BED3481|nr:MULTISPECIES: HindIII family type II restriction endonuclease [unclassified Exiguobacterium]